MLCHDRKLYKLDLTNDDYVLTFGHRLLSKQEKKTPCNNVLAIIAMLSETNVESITISQGTKAGK